MQKKDAKSVNDILSLFFEANPNLNVSVAEHRVVGAWRELLGQGVAKYTKDVYFKRNVLYVKLSSSVLRSELIMSKEQLIKRLNEHVNMNIINDIIIR